MRKQEVKVRKTDRGLIGMFPLLLRDGGTIDTETPPIPEDTTRATWLRAPSSSGGKDWICCTTPRGGVTVWGKKWQANQSSNPKRVDPHRLIAGKLLKGYEHFAHFNLRSWQFVNPVMPDSHDGIDDEVAAEQPVAASLLDSAITSWVETQRSDWF